MAETGSVINSHNRGAYEVRCKARIAITIGQAVRLPGSVSEPVHDRRVCGGRVLSTRMAR
jgi:hypothetical protein